MPTWGGAMVGIYGCGFICPFSMMRNQGFDEVKGPKNLGRHQRPNTQSGRPSAMSAVARAPSPVKDWRSRTRRAILSLLDVIADLICDLLSGKEKTIEPINPTTLVHLQIHRPFLV